MKLGTRSAEYSPNVILINSMNENLCELHLTNGIPLTKCFYVASRIRTTVPSVMSALGIVYIYLNISEKLNILGSNWNPPKGNVRDGTLSGWVRALNVVTFEMKMMFFLANVMLTQKAWSALNILGWIRIGLAHPNVITTAEIVNQLIRFDVSFTSDSSAKPCWWR